MAKQKLTFEASMQRLDEIVKQLEKGDVPLDASLALFEEGSHLLKTRCSTPLSRRSCS